MDTPSPTPLSARLEALYDLVPDDARAVADVGYDRGELLAAIIGRRPAVRAIGVELQPAAAARLRAERPALVAAAGARLELRTGSGLAALTPADALDGVVIAGIGARTIAALLRAEADTVRALRWLALCPPRFHGALRPALAELGLYCAEERLVADRGRVYEVILARPGAEPDPDPVRRRYGPRLFERRDPLLLDYLTATRARFADAFANGLASYGPDSPKAALGEKLRLLDAAITEARRA